MKVTYRYAAPRWLALARHGVFRLLARASKPRLPGVTAGPVFEHSNIHTFEGLKKVRGMLCVTDERRENERMMSFLARV
jgi:hypothetical protein